MTSMTLEAAAPATPDPFGAVMEITSRPPVVFVEGRGSWLRDQDGKDYLDFIQGWAVNCLGHCPKPIVDAIVQQAGRLMNCSPAYYNAPMIRLAELIARHSGLDRTFLTTCQLRRGGRLDFWLGALPNRIWGAGAGPAPPSAGAPSGDVAGCTAALATGGPA